MTRPANLSAVRPGDRVRVQYLGQVHDQHVVRIRSVWALDVRIEGKLVEIPYGDFLGLHAPG